MGSKTVCRGFVSAVRKPPGRRFRLCDSEYRGITVPQDDRLHARNRVCGQRDPSASIIFVNLRTVRVDTPDKYDVSPRTGDEL